MIEQERRQKLQYSIDLEFRFCKGLPEVERVKSLVHLLVHEGFHPSSRAESRELHIVSDISTLIDAHLIDFEAEGREFGSMLRSTGFPIIVEGFPIGRTWCAFQWAVFKGGKVQMGLSGAVDAVPEEQRKYQEPLAERFLALALKLYPVAQPVDGYIADPDVESNPWQDPALAERKIITLNWVNFLGPEYVAKYGQEMLAGIPGWRTQDLPDGGLLYQSRPSIVVEDEVAHRHWQREAAAYLAEQGIRIRFDYPWD